MPDNAARGNNRQSLELKDVSWVSSNPQGIRFLAWECSRLGLGSIPAPEDLDSFAMAIRLLQRVNRANPEAAMIILAACFQIPWSSDLLNQLYSDGAEDGE